MPISIDYETRQSPAHEWIVKVPACAPATIQAQLRRPTRIDRVDEVSGIALTVLSIVLSKKCLDRFPTRRISRITDGVFQRDLAMRKHNENNARATILSGD